jgi:peptidyl-prolyl cis-trans isomerase A (cyclophilin A)
MRTSIALAFSLALFATACSSQKPTPAGDSDGSTAPDAGEPPDGQAGPDGQADPLAGCTKDPGAPTVQVDPNAASDPTGGADKFTMAQALAGFPDGSGTLTAFIATEAASIRCTLDEAAAPVSVANFVGLSRGTRPYKIDASGWKVGRFYDGLTWHRVIPNFVIQGGDPLGDGTGGPGYSLTNENHVAEPLGTLAMAASTEPSGSQFYIVVGKGPAANYNVFGTCTTDAAIAIANVPRDANDKPKTPIHMQRIDIARCP